MSIKEKFQAVFSLRLKKPKFIVTPLKPYVTGNVEPVAKGLCYDMYSYKEDKLQTLIKEVLLLPTFSFKRFDTDRKVCVDKIGIDIKDLHRLLNQFRESSFEQSESVCSSIS